MVANSKVVVHLRPTNFYGGPEKQIVEHAVIIRNCGWHPIVASFQESRREVDFLRRASERGLTTASLKTKWQLDIRLVRELLGLLRESNASLIVSHGYKSDVVGFHASRAAGIPMVACVRGFTGENAKIRFYEMVDRIYLRRMRVVVAVSNGSAKMLQSCGVRPERIRVVENAVIVPEHLPEGADLRHEFGIPEAARIVVAAGRLSVEKGQDILIRAIAILRDEEPPVHVVLVGAGSQHGSLVTLAQKLGVSDRVHFGGFRNDVLACLAAADLVVNPSHTEGMPNVVLEAMSIGAPVLATAVGGVPEILEDGVTGWLVPPGSPGKMAEVIRNVLRSSHWRGEAGRAARLAVTSRYTFQRQAEAWLRVYESSQELGP